MKEKHIKVNGLSISLTERHITAIQTPIIYIHGWLDNSASFNLLAPLIKNHPSFALDLPGHGMSDHISPFAYYHFIDGVSQLIETINVLKLQKCILIGHSLGACLASIVAGAIPNKIEKLVLLDAIGPLTTPDSDSAIKYQLYLKQLSIIKRKKNRHYENIMQASEHRAINGHITKEHVEDIVKRGLIYKDNSYQWRHDPRLLLPSPMRMTEAQTLTFLKEITAPTLLLNATEGFKFSREAYQLRITAVKQLTVKEIKSGHHLHIETPTLCAHLINDFLND